MPSLNQLNEAIAAYRADHPDALITVVVDATFGHRIDPAESAEFERNIETNAFVAPPAGAVGRGDGFVLSIAQKVNATILSNDSYQEFHGEYAWLFDEGRLVGGKPVPHVGWVFVNRVPVRGPISRRSVKEQKVVEKSPTRVRGRAAAVAKVPSVSANGPMPIPKAPPPGAVLRRGRAAVPVTETASGDNGAGAPSGPTKAANDLMPFIGFVEMHAVGTLVDAVVDHYSSHGAYVLIDDVVAYVPLRLMADPAPRSAREIMGVGATVSLVVSSFTPAKRSIELAMPAMAPAPVAAAPVKPRRTAKPKGKADVQTAAADSVAHVPVSDPTVSDSPTSDPLVDQAYVVSAPARRRRSSSTKQARVPDIPAVVADAAAKPKTSRRGRGAKVAELAPTPAPAVDEAAAKKRVSKPQPRRATESTIIAPMPVAEVQRPARRAVAQEAEPAKASNKVPAKVSNKAPAKAPNKAPAKASNKAPDAAPVPTNPVKRAPRAPRPVSKQARS